MPVFSPGLVSVCASHWCKNDVKLKTTPLIINAIYWDEKSTFQTLLLYIELFSNIVKSRSDQRFNQPFFCQHRDHLTSCRSSLGTWVCCVWRWGCTAVIWGCQSLEKVIAGWIAHQRRDRGHGRRGIFDIASGHCLPSWNQNPINHERNTVFEKIWIFAPKLTLSIKCNFGHFWQSKN